MAGCYGNTPEDRHFERELNKHLAQWDENIHIVAEQLRLYEERVMDIHGYFIESLTEGDESKLKRIAALVLADNDPAEIGRLVTDMVEQYCNVTEAEAAESLGEPEEQE